MFVASLSIFILCPPPLKSCKGVYEIKKYRKNITRFKYDHMTRSFPASMAAGTVSLSGLLLAT